MLRRGHGGYGRPGRSDTLALMPSVEIAPATRPGAVCLTVSDLDSSVAFYERSIGLQVRQREGARVRLGAGAQDLLVLSERPGAAPARGYCGLYHFALLLPERTDLARWLAHAAHERISLTGLSDHYVSEAIYLSDPDDHGIEIYCDRPREVWEGEVAQRMTTLPLDTSDLLAELDRTGQEPWRQLPAGTTMGHVHLRVADIPQTIAFYRDVLGFGLTASFDRQAAFLSAGGYHHHIGANTWESADAPPAPDGTASLRRATLVLPSHSERESLLTRVTDSGQDPLAVDEGMLVRDPSGNRLLLAVASP
jgi:catechol 2,3-dioxygenase